MILNKQNLEEYLKSHYPQFCTGPLTISMIGDGADDDDNPGVINNVYRVKNGKESLIIKQGQPRAASGVDLTLPVDRNAMECESLLLRGAIMPDMIPTVYYHDRANNVFFMEDVSYLRPSRFLLSEGNILPRFGEQVAEFCAKNSFYLSEFYLDIHDFRDLSAHFTNTDMRQVMEEWVFLRHTPYSKAGVGDPAIVKSVDEDQALNARIHYLRHKFMTHGESFVHADTHTSNIFADEDRIKVLDMEYTFAGPIGYDLGYFISSLLTQYCSAAYRPFPSEKARGEFKAYLIKMMYDAFTRFIQNFSDYWDADAKPDYKADPLFKEMILADQLPDVLGYAAIPALLQVTVTKSPVTEFGMIQDPVDRTRALALCMYICRFMLLKGEQYTNMADFLADMVKIEELFDSRF